MVKLGTKPSKATRSSSCLKKPANDENECLNLHAEASHEKQEEGIKLLNVESKAVSRKRNMQGISRFKTKGLTSRLGLYE